MAGIQKFQFEALNVVGRQPTYLELTLSRRSCHVRRRRRPLFHFVEIDLQ